ncbi:unnamed protein product [Musa acuminata subsp. burmannicoides]
MEGIIPFIYRAITQHANGGEDSLQGSWFDESPSAYYMRLLSDSSGLRSSSGIKGFSTSPPAPAPAATKLVWRTTWHQLVRRSQSMYKYGQTDARIQNISSEVLAGNKHNHSFKDEGTTTEPEESHPDAYR